MNKLMLVNYRSLGACRLNVVMRLIECVALGQWLVGALPNSITSCFLGVWLILRTVLLY